MKRIVALVLSIFLLMMIISSNVFAESQSTKRLNGASSNNSEIVKSVIKAVNKGDVYEYISFYDTFNQQEMQSYLAENGKDDFFQEKNIKLISMKVLSNNTGILAADVMSDEIACYDEIEVIYTKEQITAKSTADRIADGLQYKAYVLGIINGNARVLRISQPNIKMILDAGEGFANDPDDDQYSDVQIESLLFLPSTICIYFTKSANITYHGSTRANIDFVNYLKNVIPNEFYVSYFSSTPAYLQAGAMAVKMYSWYYEIHPKRNSAPYYADLLDNSNDQNYLATAYSSLTSTYKSYVDSALSTISITAMVKDWGGAENNIFEVHYHQTNGTQYSGQLSASGARSLAISGYTYQDILRYYFDYCPKADGNPVVFRIHQ
jgi:hypothetical protein